jgi:hypothetical protein
MRTFSSLLRLASSAAFASCGQPSSGRTTDSISTRGSAGIDHSHVVLIQGIAAPGPIIAAIIVRTLTMVGLAPTLCAARITPHQGLLRRPPSLLWWECCWSPGHITVLPDYYAPPALTIRRHAPTMRRRLGLLYCSPAPCTIRRQRAHIMLRRLPMARCLKCKYLL